MPWCSGQRTTSRVGPCLLTHLKWNLLIFAAVYARQAGLQSSRVSPVSAFHVTVER